MSRSLIVLPDDSARPIVDIIDATRRTLCVKMFVFDEPGLLHAVTAAKQRGVRVRVMLNPARRDGEHDNEHTRRALLRADIEVRNSNPAFDLTHEKSMIADETVAVVKSLNWTTEDVTETRDYAVVTTRRHDVAETIECFEADWHRTPFDLHDKRRLIWCPGGGRDHICGFIDAAKHWIFIQNERYQDMVIIEHLVRAARRGVTVQLMARRPHTLKRSKLVEGVGGLRILHDVGIKVHTLKHLKLHAKMLLADGKRAIVGSINLAPGSLDGRRELAIEVRDRHVVQRLRRIAQHDWERSHRIDLSDAGLRADLEEHYEGSAAMLGLDP
jgi:cardiolipin synthase